MSIVKICEMQFFQLKKNKVIGNIHVLDTDSYQKVEMAWWSGNVFCLFSTLFSRLQIFEVNSLEIGCNVKVKFLQDDIHMYHMSYTTNSRPVGSSPDLTRYIGYKKAMYCSEH